MICAELIFATEIILLLQSAAQLPAVIIPAKAELVELTIRSFHLPYVIVRQDGNLVTVRKMAAP